MYARGFSYGSTMSQMELALEALLNRRPEIEKCYREGLINRRALARFLIDSGVARPDQFDAVVALLRRRDFGTGELEDREAFREVRLGLKDRILILDFEREKGLLGRIERLLAQVDVGRGETLKIVVGSATVKLVVDARKEGSVRHLLEPHRPQARLDEITEVSLLFPEPARDTRGILSWVTRELALRDVLIRELLTASPELLLYVGNDDVPSVLAVVRGLQAAAAAPVRPPGRRR